MTRTLTKRLEYVEQYEVLIGIDLGKRRNVAAAISAKGKMQGKRIFGHSQAAYGELLSWAEAKAPGKVLIGFEGTNDFWRWLANYLEEEGQPYRLVNPFAVKRSREAAQLDYAKDDLRDALAISYLLRNGQFTETQLLQGKVRQWREMERAHWRLTHDLGRAKTMLRQQVELCFPELSNHFRKLEGATVQALLRSQTEPGALAACSWSEVEAAVRQRFGGKRLAVKKLRQLHGAATTSIGLPLGNTGQLLIEQQLAQIALLQQQLDQLEAALVAGLMTHPAADALLSLGIGPLNMALIVSEIGDFSHFCKGAQLVKLAGIQPTPNQSGEMERQRTPMSHKGRPRLRTYLFWACLRLVQTDDAFAARHHRQVQRMTKLQSIGALMNHLLHVIWALQRTQQPYVPHLPT